MSAPRTLQTDPAGKVTSRARPAGLAPPARPCGIDRDPRATSRPGPPAPERPVHAVTWSTLARKARSERTSLSASGVKNCVTGIPNSHVRTRSPSLALGTAIFNPLPGSAAEKSQMCFHFTKDLWPGGGPRTPAPRPRGALHRGGRATGHRGARTTQPRAASMISAT